MNESGTVRVVVILCAIALLAIGERPCVGALQPGDRVSFDNENFVVVERPDEATYASGSTALLMVTRDGTTSTITWTPDQSAARGSSPEQIHYCGRDRIWVISRLGHRMAGAVLLDLRAQRTVRFYHGSNFVPSPDGSRIANAFPAGMVAPCGVWVYVDDLRLYPTIEDGLTTKGEGLEPTRPTALKPTRKPRPVGSGGVLASRFYWRDNDTVGVVIEEPTTDSERDKPCPCMEDDAPCRTVYYEFSGIGGRRLRMDRVRVREKTLSGAEKRNLREARISGEPFTVNWDKE
jgi:hypothetical protein